MSNDCLCLKLGKGAQLFRIRDASKHFAMIEDLGEDLSFYASARQVWHCRACNQPFAYMKVLFDKDEEEVLVRAASPEWTAWNWDNLIESASSSRWHGPDLDAKYLI